jgi:NDP-sugar pyrophosphorylase family protein
VNELGAEKAILLLAGRGRRLGSLTDSRPKCLIPVGGRAILARSLAALAASGVREAVLVLGYRAELVREAVGRSSTGNMEIHYVVNERYEYTNTAYSLWLAREHFDDAVMLVEGDIVFGAGLVRRLSETAGPHSSWAAVPVGPSRDEGILLEELEEGRVGRVVRVTDPASRPAYLTWKCGGLQLLAAPLAAAMVRGLDEEVRGGGERTFADLVLGRHAPDHVVRICPVEAERWAEIDDTADLVRARATFSTEEGVQSA